MNWILKPGTSGRIPIYVLLFLGWYLGLSACQTNKPEEISMSEDKLARIMADVSIADAATAGLGGYPKDSLLQAYFKQVFEIHGTTLEIYEKDLKILSGDLSKLDRVVKKADTLLTEGLSPIAPK